MIDMHLHSLCSDGEKTVSELILKLLNSGVKYASLTDHDTICGSDSFENECKKVGINTVPGVELEAFYDKEKLNYLHLLCYDYNNKKTLKTFLEEEREKRILAINKYVNYFRKNGYAISFDDIQKEMIGNHILINHLCAVLEKKNIFKTKYDAYKFLLSNDTFSSFNYPRYTMEEIMILIKEIDGKSVLAHPNRLRMGNNDKETIIKKLVDYGLMGIESYYFMDNYNEMLFSNYIAQKYNLIETVGSDWHYENENINFGNKNITSYKEKILRKEFFHE